MCRLGRNFPCEMVGLVQFFFSDLLMDCLSSKTALYFWEVQDTCEKKSFCLLTLQL